MRGEAADGSVTRSGRAVLAELADLDRRRRSLVGELQVASGIRDRGMVGALGEWIAARYYEVELAPVNNRGYDLVTKDSRRVQVRTIRSTPENYRYVLGKMREPYDTLLAIRFDQDFVVTDALEANRDAVEDVFDGRSVTWSTDLERIGQPVDVARLNALLARF